MLFNKKRKIQATAPQYPIDTLSLVGNVGKGVAGLSNSYVTYLSQVIESYRKYNGQSKYGCQQLRATVDIRTSFIAGDGLSITVDDEATQSWVSGFLAKNKLFGTRFFDMVLGTELTGKALVYLDPIPGDIPRAVRLPWSVNNDWQVVPASNYDFDNIVSVIKKVNNSTIELPIKNFAYFRTGGDDQNINAPTTRIGIVLSEFENYDRAQKDLRLNNYVAARITPDLETGSDQETKEAVESFKESRWKIGKMRIGTGKFSYKTPSTGAADNLKAEMATSIKTIAAVTGIPVHWIGWSDLLNNRATADSLYETITNATTRERAILADGVKDLLIKAQELYINTGGTMISTVNRDIQVTIPVVDRSNFVDLVRALSMAYNDEAISMEDYRSALPGVDPMQTKKQTEVEQAAMVEKIKNSGGLIPPGGGNNDG